jgi:hypothetical protein
LKANVAVSSSGLIFGLGELDILFIVCHLTGIFHSGGNPELWQNIGLKDKPTRHNGYQYQCFFHITTPLK